MMTKYSFSERLLPQHISILQKYAESPPVRVGALAAELGLKVTVAALPLNISGLIEPDGSGSYIIKVNRFEPKSRQRFTIAHEISHFLLHRDKIHAGIIDSVLYRSKLSSRIEAEANKLAADIIMPRSLVEDVAQEFTMLPRDQMIDKLADRFDVSKQAMEIRINP